MGKELKYSVTVALSLLGRLRDHKSKDEVLESIFDILIKNKICTKRELKQCHARWDSLMAEIQKKVDRGTSFDEAFSSIISSYPEFNGLNIN